MNDHELLNVEDWAEIRRLRRAEGMAIRAIARRLGISKNTVKKAPGSHTPPRYERVAKGSIVDAVEPEIRALLAEFPEMPSTVIMERVGWERGKTVFFERGPAAAAVVQSGVADGVSAGRARAVRSVVTAS